MKALSREQRGGGVVGGCSDEVTGLDVHESGADGGFAPGSAGCGLSSAGCGLGQRAGALHQGVHPAEPGVGEERIFRQERNPQTVAAGEERMRRGWNIRDARSDGGDETLGVGGVGRGRAEAEFGEGFFGDLRFDDAVASEL